MPAAPRTAGGRLLLPALITLTLGGVLVGLGAWQVQRLHWKQGVLRQIDIAEQSPPVTLAADATPAPFQKISITGHMLPARILFGIDVRDQPTGPVLGERIVQPLLRAHGPPVLVDRGWAPDTDAAALPTPAGTITVTGYARAPVHAGPLSAKDDTAGRRFYTLDPAAMGMALGLVGTAPFTLVAMGPPGIPDPAQALPRPPNDHLSYAITWFSLAVVLLAMFAAYARGVLARPRSPA